MAITDNIPETPRQAIAMLEAAMEHAAHGWHALEKPDRPHNQDRWPPDLQFKQKDIGSPTYHFQAMMQYTHAVLQGFYKMDEPDELASLDEGYGEVPED